MIAKLLFVYNNKIRIYLSYISKLIIILKSIKN